MLMTVLVIGEQADPGLQGVDPDPGPDPDPEEVTLGAGAEVEAVVGPLEESVGVAAGTE